MCQVLDPRGVPVLGYIKTMRSRLKPELKRTSKRQEDNAGVKLHHSRFYCVLATL